MVSILAASTVEGSVHLALVSTSASKQKDSGSLPQIEIQERLTCKLFPESRIPTTKLAWKKRDHDFILAVSRNGSLGLSIHPFQAFPSLSSTQVSCRHKSYSRPVGKTILWQSNSLRTDHDFAARWSRHSPSIAITADQCIQAVSLERADGGPSSGWPSIFLRSQAHRIFTVRYQEYFQGLWSDSKSQ